MRLPYCPGMTVTPYRMRRRRFVRGGVALAALAVPALSLPPMSPTLAQTRMLVPRIDREGDAVRLATRYFLEDHNARYRLGVGTGHPAFRETDIVLALDGVAEAPEPVEYVEDLGPTRVRVGRVLAKGYVLDGDKHFWRDSVTLEVTVGREAVRRMGGLYFFLAVSGGIDSQGKDIWRVEQAGTVDTTFL